MAEREVAVVVQIAGKDVLAGRLWTHRRRGAESATFSYMPEYLSNSDAYQLDPRLDLWDGQQQTPTGQAMFGAFSDCAPDRWGRLLINRNEARRAAREQGTERSCGEIDYLLGVRDDMRHGAVRFRDPGTGAFLADETDGVPPLLELPVLLNAAEHLEHDSATDDELRALLRGGSSLGGARPKAHIRGERNQTAIAKFPRSGSDEWDVMRWESVALQLARSAGISVPRSTLHVVEGKPVLIIDRFDRVGDQRVGYVSAMTMLEAADGQQRSYLEIAEVIERNSPNASDDLEELWRRIAFSISISNTDDHLRNHGFLRTTTSGWSLSPAFDLNPNPSPGPKLLSTAITLDESSASLEILRDVAEFFRLGEARSQAILGEVETAVGRWRAAAVGAGIAEKEIEEMAPAFEPI